MIFITKTSHLASLWNGGWGELGNGQLQTFSIYRFWVPVSTLSCFIPQISSALTQGRHIRRLAIRVLRNMLVKHELDDRYEGEVRNFRQYKEISRMKWKRSEIEIRKHTSSATARKGRERYPLTRETRGGATWGERRPQRWMYGVLSPFFSFFFLTAKASSNLHALPTSAVSPIGSRTAFPRQQVRPFKPNLSNPDFSWLLRHGCPKQRIQPRLQSQLELLGYEAKP